MKVTRADDAFGVSFVPLVALLLVRQTFNAVPLSRFVPELSLARSVQNDLSANVVGTFSPPPSDVVLRISMFKSWRIDPVDGMAGVALNALAFYAVRFFAPALGVLLLAFQEVERGQLIAAFLSTLVAAAVVIGIWLIARGDRFAALLGYAAGRAGHLGRSPHRHLGHHRNDRVGARDHCGPRSLASDHHFGVPSSRCTHPSFLARKRTQKQCR
jgi:hypothetical protein